MKTLLHASAGIFALLMLIAYFVAEICANAWYTPEDALSVQRVILQSMWAYIPFILIAGSIGLVLGNARKELIVETKKKRMFLVVLFSIFVLLPSNYLLASNTLNSEMMVTLMALAILEAAVEIVLIVLLILNFRDGTKLTENRPTAP